MKSIFRGTALALSTTALGGIAHAQQIPSIPSDSVMQSLEAAKAPPVLQYLMDSGVKLTYLGNAGGVESYLGESPTGSTQTFYVTPDGKHVVAGVLFREGGVNVTGVQIAEMQDRYEAAKLRAEKAGETLGAATPETVPAPSASDSLAELTPAQIQAGEAVTPSADEYLSNRDLDGFRAELEDTAWFGVGAEDAPAVYMIADPNCPFCHRIWQDLRPMVMTREISLRVIMIAGLNGSEPKAISILARDNPQQAWMAGEGSTRAMPVAPPPAAASSSFKDAVRYLDRNMDFIEKHGIKSTPHMFYFDKEGTLYESRGIPDDRAVFFSALEGRE
jgi:thiol:disulfide interchange protein DsbG